MKRVDSELARPHGSRHFDLVRAGPEGAFWLAPDGMMVRVAAPEGGRMREAEWRHTHRAELEIALGRSGAT